MARCRFSLATFRCFANLLTPFHYLATDKALAPSCSLEFAHWLVELHTVPGAAAASRVNAHHIVGYGDFAVAYADAPRIITTLQAKFRGDVFELFLARGMILPPDAATLDMWREHHFAVDLSWPRRPVEARAWLTATLNRYRATLKPDRYRLLCVRTLLMNHGSLLPSLLLEEIKISPVPMSWRDWFSRLGLSVGWMICPKTPTGCDLARFYCTEAGRLSENASIELTHQFYQGTLPLCKSETVRMTEVLWKFATRGCDAYGSVAHFELAPVGVRPVQ